jgi:hypothetical protein
MTLITLTRPEAVRAIVARKARTLGAHPTHIVLAQAQALARLNAGHTAHRAIRAGVMLAAELTDNPDPRL